MSTTEFEPVEVPRLSMKERQRQLREDAILDAAVEFLGKKGFPAMTLDDITESIGISRPTLYQHFGSKEEMVVQVVIRNLRGGVEKLRDLDRQVPPIERLIVFLDWAMENRFGSCKCVFSDFAQILVEAKEKNPKYKALIEEFRTRFAALIEEGQRAGQVRSDIRAPLLAEAVMAIYKSNGFDELIQKGASTGEEIRACIVSLLEP